MFENHIIYTIHPASEQCSSVASEELPLTTQIQELLADYKRPKNPRIIIQLIRPFINDKMIVILPSKADKSIKIHLVDLLTILQNPGNTSLSLPNIKILKSLKQLITLPFSSVINKAARKILFNI